MTTTTARPGPWPACPTCGSTSSRCLRRSGHQAADWHAERVALWENLDVETKARLAAGTLTATAAAQLARQTATTGSGTVATRAPARPAWFTKSHPLARLVRETCTHRDTRKVVGGVGCGQCWQNVIVADARREVRA